MLIAYTYDPLGRLIEAAYSSGERFEYSYDEVGNRKAMTTTEGTTTYTYDLANRLTSVGSVTYTWDAAPTSRGTVTCYPTAHAPLSFGRLRTSIRRR